MSDIDETSFLKEALSENGFGGVSVTAVNDKSSMKTYYQFEATIGGDDMTYNHSMTDRQRLEVDDIQTHLAYIADVVSRHFESKVTEQFEWGDKAVKFSQKEDYTALCLRCGSEVTVEDLNKMSLRRSETAAPQQSSVDFGSLPPVKRRLALLAVLRDTCEDFCTNSPFDPLNQFDRKF